LKVFVAPGSDEIAKYQAVVRAFPNAWGGSILDVGCRSGNFKSALGDPVRYTGLDLSPPAQVVASVEQGLPFSDQTFDTVVALDVLEHTNEIGASFRESCRVTRHNLVLTLPNMYLLDIRLRFLRGRPIGGKYGLPLAPPRDRHRWVFSFSEARQFCAFQAGQCGFRVLSEGCLVGPRRGAGFNKLAIARFPDLLCPTYLMLAGRNG